MNWIRQMFCSHQMESTEHEVIRKETVGGYVWSVVRFITTIHCKKCGYTKKLVA